MKAMGAAVVTEAVVGAVPVTTWLMAVARYAGQINRSIEHGLVESGVMVCTWFGGVPVVVSGHWALETGRGGILTPMSSSVMLLPLSDAPRMWAPSVVAPRTLVEQVH